MLYFYFYFLKSLKSFGSSSSFISGLHFFCHVFLVMQHIFLLSASSCSSKMQFAPNETQQLAKKINNAEAANRDADFEKYCLNKRFYFLKNKVLVFLLADFIALVYGGNLNLLTLSNIYGTDCFCGSFS